MVETARQRRTRDGDRPDHERRAVDQRHRVRAWAGYTLGRFFRTAAKSATLQPFDPRTTTPVEGVHYTYATNFGQALNNMAYQTPRRCRVSLGVKF